MRDAAPMLVLGKLLEAYGHKVVVSSRMTTSLYLRLWKPHHLVHSNPMQFEGLEKTGLLGPDGPRVSIVAQEGNERQEIVVRRFYEGMLTDDALRYVDCVFHWNQDHADWFVKHTRFTPDQNMLVGNPRMDICKFSPPDSRRRKRRVGFVGRFPTINKYYESNLLEQLLCYRHQEVGSGTWPPELIEIRNSAIARQVANYVKYGEIINRLMHETDVTVSMRPHHEESSRCAGYLGLKRIYGDRFEIDRNLSVYMWARDLDVIITTSSLTFAEASVAGTPVICVDRLTKITSFLDQESRDIINVYDDRFLPDTDKKLFEMIETVSDPEFPVPKNPDVDAYLARDFNYPYPGSALAHIARRIDASDKGPKRMALMPQKAIAQLYWLQLLRIYRRHPRSGFDKDYHPMIHPTPKYIERIVDDILSSEGAGLPSTADPLKAA